MTKKNIILTSITALVILGSVVGILNRFQQPEITVTKFASAPLITSAHMARLGLVYEEEQFGAAPVTATNWSLASPLSSSATTITLTDVNDLRGNAVATTSLPFKIYLGIEAETITNFEIVVCPRSGFDQVNKQFNNCTRGLAFSGSSESAVTANQKDHPAGASANMTNVGQFFNSFVGIYDDNTIFGSNTFSGVNTFSVYPESSVGSDATTSVQFVTLNQLNNVAIQGSATSTETNAGISELATSSENASSTVFGLNSPHVQQSQHATSTPSDNILIVNAGVWDVWTENDGKINQSFLDLTEQFTFSGNVGFTGQLDILGNTYTNYLGGSFNIGWSQPQLQNATGTLNVLGDSYFTGQTYINFLVTADFNAGETMDGTINPVAVYMNAIDGELYKAKATTTDAGNFIGFVVNSTSDGVEAQLVSSGIIATSTMTLAETITASKDQYSEAGGDASSDLEFNSEETFGSQCFKTGDNVGNVSKIGLFMLKEGVPTGSMFIELYAMGSVGKPTGPSLATSTDVSATSISGTNIWVETFVFTVPYENSKGEELCMVVKSKDTNSWDTNKTIHWRNDNSENDVYKFVKGTYDVDRISYNTTDSGGTWNDDESFDFRTYYTEKQHWYGDNIYLSETDGVFTLNRPTNKMPLIKLGKLMSDSKIKIEEKNPRFVGKVIVANDGINGKAYVGVPPNADYAIVENTVYDETTSQGVIEVMIIKGEKNVSSGFQSGDTSQSGSNNLTWNYDSNIIEITTGDTDTINVTAYFYSY